ncbi:MAG: methyltransferase domain-containing protein [Alphaproteobacteria bacterium]|nr:methyltransferase domain-containing protein [Alphaproteobacteria bacterium]
MAKTSHEDLVDIQFGARATAYLASAVHAQGEDLVALAHLAQGHPHARVLDLGCGGGHVSFRAAASVHEVVAYDLSADMLAVVSSAAQQRGIANITTQRGRVETLPFESKSFDIVLSRYSAHHWHDFAAGLKEAARVLKCGGTAGFVDVVSPGTALFDSFLQAIELMRDPSHVRDYSRAEWETALAAAGLTCEATQRFRVRLDFEEWVERMKTPAVQVDAIRTLQRAVSSDVRDYFQVAEDGSFSIDVALFSTFKRNLETSSSKSNSNVPR